MNVRLLRPIGYRKSGSTLTVGDGVGELWILQRKAERVKSSQPEAMVPARPTQGNQGRPKRARSKGTTERVTTS